MNCHDVRKGEPLKQVPKAGKNRWVTALGREVSAQSNEVSSNNESCPKLLQLSSDRMSSWTWKASKQRAGNILLGATEVRVRHLRGLVQLPVPVCFGLVLTNLLRKFVPPCLHPATICHRQVCKTIYAEPVHRTVSSPRGERKQ